jgi:hypothetical protein
MKGENMGIKLIVLVLIVSCGLTFWICNTSSVFTQHEFHKSPSETVLYFWQASFQNRGEDVKNVITQTPEKYWIRCNEQNTSINEEKVKIRKAGELSSETLSSESNREFLKKSHYENLISFSRLIRINKADLSSISITEESMIDDAAIVTVDYKVTDGYIDQEKFLLTKDNNQWKIFLIASDAVPALNDRFGVTECIATN